MQSKFIVLEGIDGAGKTSQTDLLIKRLQKQGDTVKTIHFPQHGQEIFGNLVDAYLAGEFGPAPKLDYRLASLLYALDRYQAKDKINHWLTRGCWVILDRYAESNFGHQGAKIKNKAKRLKVIQWLHDLDYEVLKNPKPDLVLFLDVPAKFSLRLMKFSNRQRDGHENDKKYLNHTHQAYLDSARKFKYWQTINCLQQDKLLTIKQVHERIWKRIKKFTKA